MTIKAKAVKVLTWALGAVLVSAGVAWAATLWRVDSYGNIKAARSTVLLNDGDTSNCVWKNEGAGTIEIVGSNGEALSAANPCCVGVHSTAHNSIKTLCATAPVSFKDSAAGAASDLLTWTFGVTTGVAWNTQMPVFIYALNKDDTSAGLVFGISRSPVAYRFQTANIGDKAGPPAGQNQNNIFIAETVVAADYNQVPAMLIGAARMSKPAAADDWTISVTGNLEGIGRRFINNVIGLRFEFPTGQNEAQAGFYTLAPAGGNNVAWTTQSYYWHQHLDGFVSAFNQFSGDGGNDGSHASSIAVALPLAAQTPFGVDSSPVGACLANGSDGAPWVNTGSGPRIADNTAKVYFYKLATATTGLNYGDFLHGSRNLRCNFTYPAFRGL